MYYLPELYGNICTKKCMLCVEMAFTDFRLCAQFHCKKKDCCTIFAFYPHIEMTYRNTDFLEDKTPSC